MMVLLSAYAEVTFLSLRLAQLSHLGLINPLDNTTFHTEATWFPANHMLL